MFIVLAVNRRSKPIRKHLIVGRVPYSIYIVEYAPFGWCVVIFYAIGTGKNELSIVSFVRSYASRVQHRPASLFSGNAQLPFRSTEQPTGMLSTLRKH